MPRPSTPRNSKISKTKTPAGGLYDRSQLLKIKQYMREELNRSRTQFKIRGKPRIYYISYLFRNQHTDRLWGRLGAINETAGRTHNSVYCDVRVGSNRYDNVSGGGLEDNNPQDESVDYINLPIEISKDAFQFGLWKLTDARYREAAEQYYDRKSRELHFVEANPELPSRIKQPVQNDFKFKKFENVDLEYWKRLIRKAGLQIKKHKAIKNSWFEFISHRRQHLFLNSQGSVILQQLAIYELRFHVWVLTKDGEGLSQEVNLIEGDINDLPSEKEFLKILNARIEALLAIRTAPRINSYSGPVLLSPDACGLFFHEVVGHRLEGSRLLSPDEGATFMDLRGKRIAPDFIDIVDDPTVDTYADGRSMIGAFPYDDEGAESKRTVLVEKGVLKSFLTTSAPIPGQRKLNGHARNNLHERPISRMGNLFVINRKPTSREEIRERFIEEIKKQKKPFGIMVKEVLGGETGTGSYDFQAFKGEILSAVRVFPDGTEEPVRGVDFVGTPLSALDSVICLGDDAVMDNSYCGAESGMVPVSTIAPSMLIRNLELQSQDRERFTQYALPLPYK
ncbi:MAG: metallopeptidase TldD-related protein [bacterium]|nr:metallopeptidase TldD-related protein [bacterium]